MTENPAPPLLRALPSSGRRLFADPTLRRVRRGVYLSHDAWTALAPWERYEHRVRAFRMVAPEAVLSHESAAVAHGLPFWGEPADIHVHAPDRARTKRVGEVVLHASDDPRGVTMTPLGAAVTAVETAVDLGRVLPPAFALALWDAVVRSGVEPQSLSNVWHEQSNSRGTRTLTWLTNAADGRAESLGESVSRAVISWLGYPPPVLQQEFVWDGMRDRPDFYWPDREVLGEFDGWSKYAVQSPEAPMDSLRMEKIREDRLRRRVKGFARWTMADVLDPDRVDRILMAAGLRRVRPRDNVMLATLNNSWKRNTHNTSETPR